MDYTCVHLHFCSWFVFWFLYTGKIHVNSKRKMIKENETVNAVLLVVFIYNL